MEETKLDVEGMSCTGCEENVVNAVKNVENVLRVEADHEKNEVDITHDSADTDAIRQAVHEAGYEVVG